MSSQQTHLHSRVVEAGAAAEIGERIRDERVRGRAVVAAAAPQPLRERHGPGFDLRVQRDRAVDFAEIVEHPYRVVVREMACGGVARMHLQHTGPLAELAQRRGDGFLARRRNQRQRVLVGLWIDGRLGTKPLFTVVLGLLAILGQGIVAYYRYKAEVATEEGEKPWRNQT